MRDVCRRYRMSVQDFLGLTMGQIEGLRTPDDDGKGIEVGSPEEIASILEMLD